MTPKTATTQNETNENETIYVANYVKVYYNPRQYNVVYLTEAEMDELN
jgi:hypothetical protein